MNQPVNLITCLSRRLIRLWRKPVSSSRPGSGFTLLEVLMTVMILSIGIVGVLSSYHALLTALSNARDAVRADWVIRDRVSFVEASLAQSSSLVPAQFSGTFSMPEGTEGSISVEEIKTSPDGTNSLNELNVTVWRKGSLAQYSVTTTVLQSKRKDN